MTSGGTHSCMVTADRPLPLPAGTSTTANHPPHARRTHATWRASIHGSNRNPPALIAIGISSCRRPEGGSTRPISTRTRRSTRNNVG